MTDNFKIKIQAEVNWLEVCSSLMERYHISSNEIEDLIKSNANKYIKVKEE